MGHRSHLLVWAFALVALAGCAETPKRPRVQETPYRPATAILLAYAGPDGSLTRMQMETGLHRDFDKVDVNHNGCLDANEVRAINAERWKNDASAASPLIDFKNNGCVDFDEYAATARSLFDQLDVKGTGKLTAQQLKPSSKPDQKDQSDTDNQARRHRRGGGGDGLSLESPE